MKRKLLLSLLIVVAVFASAFGFAACTDASGSEGITLSAAMLSVEENDTVTLTASTSDGGTVTWESADTGVATVTALANTAIIKGVSAGTTTVTATEGEYTASCTVTVTSSVTYTIYKDGTALDGSLDIVRNTSVTLTATGSDGSDATYWSIADESVATVDGGVVTAVWPGTTTLYAGKDATHYTTLTINVTAEEGIDFYNLPVGEEGGTTSIDGNGTELTYGMFWYWSAQSAWGMQQVEVAYAYYQDGEIAFSYTCDTDDGFYYGFQLFYKNPNHTIGNYYTVSCTITVDADCNVTLNGNAISLKAGANRVTVNYQYTDGLGSGTTYGISSFDLVMGVDDGTYNSSNVLIGTFVQNATVSVSNIQWTEVTTETLDAPSFTVSNNVITITDTNDAEKVGGYKLYFYDENGDFAGSADVTDGMSLDDVDTSTLSKGTYTAYLRAVGSSAIYFESDNSSTSIEITVTADPSYELINGGETNAVADAGKWYYWTEWANVTTKTYDAGTITLEYSNNAGNWYNLQLFFKNATLTAGTSYTLTFTLNSTGEGTITINGTEVDIKVGENEISVVYTETSGGASVSIQFGTISANSTSITSGTIIITNVAFTSNGTSGGDSGSGGDSYNEADFTTLVSEIVAADNDSYSISHGEEAVATTNTDTFYVWYIGDYNYTADWSAVVNTDVTATYAAGVVTWSTKNSFDSAYWYANQLFYKNSALTAGTVYMLTMTIESAAAGTITINGTVVTLTAGTNNIVLFYTEGSGASLTIQLGTDGSATDLTSPSLTISNIKWYSKNSSSGGDSYNEADFTTLVSEIVAADNDSYSISHGEEAVATMDTDTFYVWYIGDYNYTADWSAVVNTDVTATYAAGVVTWSTKNSFDSAYWYANQLFYKNSALTAGTVYMLTMTIESAAAGTITINGTVVTLTAGTNNIVVFYTEGSGASLTIQLGTNGSATDLTSPSLTISNIKWYSKNSSSGGDSGDANTYTATFGESGTVLAAADGKWYYWNDQDWCGSTVTVSSAEYANSTFTITYTSTGSCWYGLQLFLKNGTLTVGKTYTVTMTVTSSVDCTITINGLTYELIANTSKEITFEWTESSATNSVSVQFGVESTSSMVSAGTFSFANLTWKEVTSGGDANTYTATFGESGTALAAADGKWYYWNDQDWCGSKVTVSSAEYANSTFTITYTSTGSCWYGLQLFLKNGTLTAGKTYKVTMTVTASVDCTITINGTTYDFVANTSKEITFEWTESNTANSISVQFGVESTLSMVSAGTFSFANLTWKEVTSGGDSGESGTATVALVFVESYSGYYFHFTATSSYDISGVSYVTVNGTQRWSECTVNGDGTYTFKVYVDDLTLSSYVFNWYDSNGNIVATATYTPSAA